MRSTIDLAHNLGLTVVAEGIENEAVLILLHELSCGEGQGWHLRKPLPVDQFCGWVARWPGGDSRARRAGPLPIGHAWEQRLVAAHQRGAALLRGGRVERVVAACQFGGAGDAEVLAQPADGDLAGVVEQAHHAGVLWPLELERC